MMHMELAMERIRQLEETKIEKQRTKALQK